jgi:DNA-binding NtrC family response regulator
MASLAYDPSGTKGHNSVRDLPKSIAIGSTGAEATILLATVDPDICASMSRLLDSYKVKAVSVSRLEELRLALSRETVSACFCGFWLVDGTYRDVVRQLRRQPIEIPVIVLCGPGCSEEYRDYLAALNIRAFDYIGYPYRKADLERILHSTVSVRRASMPSRDAHPMTIGSGPGPQRAM